MTILLNFREKVLLYTIISAYTHIIKWLPLSKSFLFYLVANLRIYDKKSGH